MLSIVLTFFSPHIFGADVPLGSNFEDYFSAFNPNLWKKDYNYRHCGGLGCMFGSDENVQYITHEDEAKKLFQSEMMIRMANDCMDDTCCKDKEHCTDHTSGQITSAKPYGYGDFTFSVQIEEDSQEYMWTCYDNFDYIDLGEEETIGQINYPLSLDPDEVIAKCKDICLNQHDDCIGFWYQLHDKVHVCNWKREYGAGRGNVEAHPVIEKLADASGWKRLISAMRKNNPGRGSVCSLRHFLKELTKKNNRDKIKVAKEEKPDTEQTTSPADFTTAEQIKSTEAESTNEAEFYENMPELDVVHEGGAPSGHSGPSGGAEEFEGAGTGLHNVMETTVAVGASCSGSECEGEGEEEEITVDEDDDYYITTTTTEAIGSDTTYEPITSTEELPFLQRHGARFCVALAGVATGIVTKISLCMNSINTQNAMVVAKQQDSYYKQHVLLPFDPTSEAGKFTIRWLPDRIIWWANDKQIAEIKEGNTAIKIPDQPLHIKIFVAPFKPLVHGTGKLLKGTGKFWKHSMHVFKTAYRKISKKNMDKTELIVIGEKKHNPLLIFGASITAVVCVLFLVWWKIGKTGPDGYDKPLLQEEFNGGNEFLVDM